jgi:hypothetical protein
MDRGKGAKAIVSLAGIGRLTPNMLLLGFKRDWSKSSDELLQYVTMIKSAFEANLAMGILRVKNGFDYSKIIGSEVVVDKKKEEKEKKKKEKELKKQQKKGKIHPVEESAAVPGPDALSAVAALKIEDEIQPKQRRVSVFRGQDGELLDTKHLAGLQMFQASKTRLFK